MADASRWAGWSNGIDAAPRADDALRRIGDKPTDLVIYRGKVLVALPSQRVRIEYDGPDNGEVTGGAGTSSDSRVTVFGVNGHAVTANTDIKRDDRFTWNGLQFRVVRTVIVLGEIQASCEVQG